MLLEIKIKRKTSAKFDFRLTPRQKNKNTLSPLYSPKCPSNHLLQKWNDWPIRRLHSGIPRTIVYPSVTHDRAKHEKPKQRRRCLNNAVVICKTHFLTPRIGASLYQRESYIEIPWRTLCHRKWHTISQKWLTNDTLVMNISDAPFGDSDWPWTTIATWH